MINEANDKLERCIEKARAPHASFNVSISDAKKIAQIVVRAAGLLGDDTIGSRLDLSMDITACHANGCRLDLDELFKAERFDFVHDVAGIARHIDRTTGQLRNCFSPRYAQRAGSLPKCARCQNGEHADCEGNCSCEACAWGSGK